VKISLALPIVLLATTSPSRLHNLPSTPTKSFFGSNTPRVLLGSWCLCPTYSANFPLYSNLRDKVCLFACLSLYAFRRETSNAVMALLSCPWGTFDLYGLSKRFNLIFKGKIILQSYSTTSRIGDAVLFATYWLQKEGDLGSWRNVLSLVRG
jgi:hypothetical protein